MLKVQVYSTENLSWLDRQKSKNPKYNLVLENGAQTCFLLVKDQASSIPANHPDLGGVPPHFSYQIRIPNAWLKTPIFFNFKIFL